MVDVLVTRPYGVGNAVQAIPALRLLQAGELELPKFTVWLESRPAINLLDKQFSVVSRLLEPGRKIECKTWVSLFPPDSGMEPDSYGSRFGYSADDVCALKGAYNWNEVETNVQIVASVLNITRADFEVPTCELWPGGGGRWGTKKDVVGIHPGCQAGDGGVWKRKRWPSAKWVMLIKTLLARKKTVRVFGMLAADGDALTPLLKSFSAVPGRVKWYLDRSVQDAAAAAGTCGAFISNDSGMGHIALAGGCQRVVMLYGPTRPEKNTHDGALPVRATTCPHQPCYGEVFSPKGKACKINKCMEAITVQRVLDVLA